MNTKLFSVKAPTSTSTESAELCSLREKNQQLLTENSKLLKDNKILKRLLDESKNIIFQKDLKLIHIEKKIAVTSNQATAQNAKILFEKYEKFFTAAEMKQLRSIGKGKRFDSTFVTKCLFFLYGGTANLLDRVPTSARVPKGKKPLTPEKVEIISNMLEERIDSENNSVEITVYRSSRTPKLLNYAFTTASRKKTVVENDRSNIENGSNTSNVDNIIQNQTFGPPAYQQPSLETIWLASPSTPITYIPISIPDSIQGQHCNNHYSHAYQ